MEDLWIVSDSDMKMNLGNIAGGIKRLMVGARIEDGG